MTGLLYIVGKILTNITMIEGLAGPASSMLNTQVIYQTVLDVEFAG